MDKRFNEKYSISPAASLSAALLLALAAGQPDAAESATAVQQSTRQIAVERIATYTAAHPQSAQAMLLRGCLLYAQGRTEQALAAFIELTARFPSLAEPYNNLGVIYAALGKYAEAREALDKAARLAPDSQTARRNLAEVYAQLTAGEYEKLAQSDAGDPGTRRKLALLQQLAALPPTGAGLPSSVQDDAMQQARSAIQRWADAWSSRDAERYFASYADDFQPPKGWDRAQWRQYRTNRLQQPAAIHVEVQALEIMPTGAASAEARFMQNYREGDVASRSEKKLVLHKDAGEWRIAQEIDLNQGPPGLAAKALQTAVK